MSDDLGMPKKFFYPNFRRLSLRFQKRAKFSKLLRNIFGRQRKYVDFRNFANFVLLRSFLHVGQSQCFPIYLPKFFLRSFQRSFKNCAPFLEIFFERSSQILPKTFSKEVFKIRILSLEKKSSKDLPKKFLKFGPRIIPVQTQS